MTYTLPPELIRSLSRLDHFDPNAFLYVHESGVQVVSVHMNTAKSVRDNMVMVAEDKRLPFEISVPVPWAPDAYYLASRPSFTVDPFFHAGVYYVQEASGMFLAFAMNQVFDLSKKIKVLDLCAAPGGKSTMIQSLISSESLLVSNEVIKTRVPVLYQNMTQWGGANVVISNDDPAHFKQLPGFFDAVVIDAPCSGSGLFRKDQKAAAEWSPDGVRLCSQRQQRILADVWDCLKEDGILIYCTCSYSKEENEDILDLLFRQYQCKSVPLSPDPAWQIVETNSDQAGAFGYRFYPYKVSGEGFFISVIQKKEGVSAPRIHSRSASSKKPGGNILHAPKSSVQQISAWLEEGSLQFIQAGDSIHAMPEQMVNDFELLKNSLYLKKAGIRVGKPGENSLIPDHELALANNLKGDVVHMELTRPDALRFLHGEPFEAEIAGKGWRLVSFGGQHLGWVKILDKRMNNYYPKSWRIRR